MAKQPITITSLPRSPDDDRHRRMVRYSITMGIRLVCVILCIFVRGWWLLLCAAGAVLLPYIAVVLANAVDARGSVVDRPGSILPVNPPVNQPPRESADGDGDDRAKEGM